MGNRTSLVQPQTDVKATGSVPSIAELPGRPGAPFPKAVPSVHGRPGLPKTIPLHLTMREATLHLGSFSASAFL